MKKVKEFVKEHKKEILIGTGVTVLGSIIGVKIGQSISIQKKTHSITITSTNKRYIELLKNCFHWNGNRCSNEYNIGYGLTDQEVRDQISKLLVEGESDKYMYSMILERINKDEV